MPKLTPAERSLLARSAVHASWAKTGDRAARTAPGRRQFQERFEREVDPDGVLTPEERAARAEQARKAYFLKLSLKAARARKAKAAASQPGEVRHAS